jgi:hypothetical protein
MLKVNKLWMLAALVLTSGLGVFASTSSALATPTGEYAVFAECPFSKLNHHGGCIYSKSQSGKVIIGKETVPVTNPIVLQGGFTENEVGEDTFYGANNEANTLSKSPQKVPGGLLGLVKCDEIVGEGKHEKEQRKSCEEIFENKITGVNATTELAEPASSIKLSEISYLFREGTALSLPVKVHLENPLLGSECYVGSNSHPIVIELTTGTTSPPSPNKPITGSPGEEVTNSEGTILTFSNNSLVNNTFAAPESSGCGLFGLLNGIINSRLSLPSASGHNTIVLNGELKQATASVVEEH